MDPPRTSSTAMNVDDFSKQTFDYLIVGGGTAGLTVACRLTENPSLRVGVLEAGEWLLHDPKINVPGLAGSYIGDKTYDWGFRTEKQENLNQRQVDICQGKALGGSSALNILVWQRPLQYEFDDWARLGNPGWEYEEFSKYMDKVEDVGRGSVEDRADYQDNHQISSGGSSGPVKVSYPKYVSPIHGLWFDALNEMGIESNPDPHQGVENGISTNLTSVDAKTRQRSYAASAYHAVGRTRSNYHVLTGAHVTKILWKTGEKPLVAVGVEFIVDGKLYSARVKLEVILSAGTYQSPATLERSGIGMESVLSGAGIHTRYHNPNVGENLQQHFGCLRAFETPPTPSVNDFADPTFFQKAMEEYLTHQSGILSAGWGAASAYTPLQSIFSKAELKHLMQCIDEAEKKAHPSLAAQYKVLKGSISREKTKTIQTTFATGFFGYAGGGKPEPGKSYVSIYCFLMHPFSRGSVHIHSADPFLHPKIDPNFLSQEIDRKLLARGMRSILSIPKTVALSKVVTNSQVGKELLDTDEDALEWVKENGFEMSHPVGSCAMLPENNGGVVDSKLRVYGTRNVRIVDASIFPITIGATPQATVYGVGEKAAQMIKDDLS